MHKIYPDQGKMKPRFTIKSASIARDGHRVAEKAFTLVEVMCSAAIVAIIFLALFYGISQGFTMTQTARESLRATQIALSRVEGLRLELWSTNQLFNPTYVPANFKDSFYPLGMNGSTSSTGTVYTGTMTIKTDPFTGASAPSYNSQMALVTVVISWQDVHYGRTNTYWRTNCTYVAEHGVQNYVYAQ